MVGLFFRGKRAVFKKREGEKHKIILILFSLSLAFYVLAQVVPWGGEDLLVEEMLISSKIMEKAIHAVRECQQERGIIMDEETDVNQTGLIGTRISPITTSVGSLEAKRTTTNPNFSALVVYLLKKAGVQEGETIAVGASSSFPALVVAVLSAARAMSLNPLVISSLGASQWGANRVDFHWLRIQECLLERGVFDVRPVALSLGGEKDTGEDMSGVGRSLLLREIGETGTAFINQPDLEENVRKRMEILAGEAGENRIRAFVNIGGSWANMGTDSGVLELKPGLTRVSTLPPPQKRGMIQEMAAQGIPVIHLLYIKGLAGRYGLPWDPVPLPDPGEGRIWQIVKAEKPLVIILGSVYFFLILLVMAFRNKFKPNIKDAVIP
ncbi:MAG: poly-gamma-glutamate system protein [Candidatus Aminicenantes bacterium]